MGSGHHRRSGTTASRHRGLEPGRPRPTSYVPGDQRYVRRRRQPRAPLFRLLRVQHVAELGDHPRAAHRASPRIGELSHVHGASHVDVSVTEPGRRSRRRSLLSATLCSRRCAGKLCIEGSSPCDTSTSSPLGVPFVQARERRSPVFVYPGRSDRLLLHRQHGSSVGVSARSTSGSACLRRQLALRCMPHLQRADRRAPAQPQL